MPREHNFLLGSGERLTHPHKLSRSSRKKKPPYTFDVARDRLVPKVIETVAWTDKLPADACPNDEVVLRVTMHPRYIAKSDYPANLFQAAHFRPIGRRSSVVVPDAWGIDRHREAAATDELFVSTTRDALRRFAADLPSWNSKHVAANELTTVERLEPFRAQEKLRSIPATKEVTLELVLHTSGSSESLALFSRFAGKFGAEVLSHRRRVVGGLLFAPVRAQSSTVERLASFSLVRVLRGMPTIRPLPTAILRAAASPIALPADAAYDESFRAVIFDGGIPGPARISLSRWVRYIEPAGIGPAVPGFEQHGLAVTSSYLFGPIGSAGEVRDGVYAPVDHVRVLDDAVTSDLAYFDVLERILRHLDSAPTPYRFINLSLGPPLPMLDDEVTAWTAELDSRLANGSALMTVAAGNDGQADASLQLNRIQPPSDAVNVLCVGAADSTRRQWKRADYSCVGPGRCPGFVKPDGVAFGGSASELFGTVGERLTKVDFAGTSFAAPFVLRTAAGVSARLETTLSPLALRALLVHRADKSRKHRQAEVGWGRFIPDPDFLTTCEDTEAVVIYQGELPISSHLRAKLPMPSGKLTGKVKITATLAISPEVDVENPSTYTRGGLEVNFRPHDQVFEVDEHGNKTKESVTEAFFGRSAVYKRPEFELRKDGHKWEPCLRNTREFSAEDLHNPVFDIYYHSREKGLAQGEPRPLPYALMVSLSAPAMPDFYSRVVQTYTGILVAVRPKASVLVQPRV